jgi:DNA-binding transcriptional LysR family regulator
MQRLPSLKSLRAFEACVRLGSFSKAAKELNVGQPAVSHQIRSLEQDLGKQLFERRGTRAIPNEAAMIYYGVVAGAFEDMARASQSIRQSVRPPGLRIGTYPGIAMFWLMPKLVKLKKRDPSLTIRVTTAERDQDIPFDDIDCAILFGDGRWAGYESRCLIREAVVPIAAPGVAPTRICARRPTCCGRDRLSTSKMRMPAGSPGRTGETSAHPRRVRSMQASRSPITALPFIMPSLDKAWPWAGWAWSMN